MDYQALAAEINARRAELDAVEQLKVSLLAAEEDDQDDDYIKRLVIAHLDAKRMRLRGDEFTEFETYAEFEDVSCRLFLKPAAGYTWSQAKDIARAIA